MRAVEDVELDGFDEPPHALSARALLPPPTRYPRMMDSSAPPLLPDSDLVEEQSLVGPAWLAPLGTSPEIFEQRVEKFDATFAPMTSLSADDVVCGCAAHGSELLENSREHLRKFTQHVASVDRSNGAVGMMSSLEAGELAHIPVAGINALVGVGLYSIAVSARFGPGVVLLCKNKLLEWKLDEKARIATEFSKRKAAAAARRAVAGCHAAWSWLKAKAAKRAQLAAEPDPADTSV